MLRKWTPPGLRPGGPWRRWSAMQCGATMDGFAPGVGRVGSIARFAAEAAGAHSARPGPTPMLQQFLARKKEYPDCMLLFQVGDFYEFFGEDARRASHLLNLALTRKSKQATELEDMCGFPVSSVDSYVEKLVMHHGVKVAICNQVESAAVARKRGHKAIVDRQVVRIVTPGSLVEDAMLSPDENNYLAALYPLPAKDQWGVAWADLSTGEFVSTTTTTDRLGNTILRCSPKEVLLPDCLHPDTEGDAHVRETLDAVIAETCMRTYRPTADFAHHALDHACKFMPRSNSLGATASQIGNGDDCVEQAAAGAILAYVAFTQQSSSLRMRTPVHLESADHMIIDSSAWKALELSKSLAGTKASSLLHCIDATISPAGSRLLASHLASPLTNIDAIETRLEGVEHFFNQPLLLKSVRKQLGQVFDVERSLQRLSARVGTPKDLRNVAATIEEAGVLAQIFESTERSSRGRYPMPPLIETCCKQLRCPQQSEHISINGLAKDILVALSDDVTNLNSKCGFVRPGFSPELDKWQRVANVDPLAIVKDELQQKYRSLLGSTRLRVGYHVERGYYIDIPHEENNKLLRQRDSEDGASALQDFVIVQSLKNSVRYRTAELRDLNRELIEATMEIARIESEIFEGLRSRVLEIADDLQALAEAIAAVDVASSHAQVALDRNFCRPVVDTSREIHIEDGRHAVVESAHIQGRNSKSMRTFVPNSLHLSSSALGDEVPPMSNGGSCWLLTGPNMGGKSTFLRQNAHIVILSQIGSFVPATFARIGVVDKLFCRVGSADDLASDKSTFMVEMQETATILTQATSRSLVIMDEVGRGTAVNDGIAIAGAVLEALCDKQVRALFATHFTVLNNLIAERYRQNVQLYRMEVLERHSPMNSLVPGLAQLVFSHRVKPGLAPHSYGIHTAALAGCPVHVVQRAAELLDEISSPRREIDTRKDFKE